MKRRGGRGPHPSPGLREVAARAEVSIATASDALNLKGRVSADTRARVRRVADELGYTANPHARGLKTGRTGRLAVQVSGSEPGVLVPGSAYFAELLNGASAESLKRGYGLLALPGATQARDLRGLPFDGAILVDPVGDEPLLDVAAGNGAPVVTTGRALAETDGAGRVATVDNDLHAAGLAVLEHLDAGGYRDIAVLVPDAAVSYARDAEEAAREWESRQRGRVRVVPVVGLSVTSAERAARALLSAAGGRPDAIYALTDDAAVGVLHAGRSLGLRIPDDLGIVSGMDTLMLTDADPPVTAVHVHAARIGREAASLLVDMIDDADRPRRVEVPFELRVRRSTRR